MPRLRAGLYQSKIMNRSFLHLPKQLVQSLSSPLILFALLAWTYHLFDLYDWNQPFSKFLCFASIFVLVAFVSPEKETRPTAQLNFVELVAFSAIGCFLLWLYLPPISPYLVVPAEGDMGYTTQHAAEVFFRQFINPYSGQVVINPSPDPTLQGYYYGPVMFMAYAGSAWLTEYGLKLHNLAYVILTATTVGLIVAHQIQDQPKVRRMTGIVAAIVAFLLPWRLWFEAFRRGAPDIFSTLTCLVSLLLIIRHRYKAAGIVLGLSLSSKLTPGVFVLIALFRLPLNKKLLFGLALGCLPLAVFASWDWQVLYRHMIEFQFTKPFDNTSIYDISPPELHFVIHLAAPLVAAYCILRYYKSSLKFEDVLRSTLLVMIVAEATFSEVHGNHLLWFFPFIAIYFGMIRQTFLRTVIVRLGLRAHDAG